ncbi:MAG: conjugal transfer protein TraX [Lachnospiraceae bacterium]|jgi:hypothetical protein|nr:conjugal transfer protein TraX [Lachnospiraceae bacterium]
MRKSLNGNQLKIIAMVAMTLDHVVSVIWPDYPTDWWIVLIHMLGRLAAPIFWFFVAEGWHYTHNRRSYAFRLFLFAIVGHFAYNFAFGIPFLPFQTSVFNQTSVLWALFLGTAALYVNEHPVFRRWQKTLLILAITFLAFPADWSSIAVLAILEISENRGNFKKQMTGMMAWVSVYALVYGIFIQPLYGVIQLFTALTIPFLKSYNGERGKWKGMKWFFYFYYPLHLILCGILRVALHGNVGVMIGG